jgi:hypothetical protein
MPVRTTTAAPAETAALTLTEYAVVALLVHAKAAIPRAGSSSASTKRAIAPRTATRTLRCGIARARAAVEWADEALRELA